MNNQPRNSETPVRVTGSIRGIDGTVREINIITTWGEWCGKCNSYAGTAAYHRRFVGQVKGERAVERIWARQIEGEAS